MRRPVTRYLLVLSCYTAIAFAQCGKDYRSNKRDGIVVADFVIVGTSTISSSELLRLERDFVDSCYDDDSEEMQERLRAGFQDSGYFSVQVKNISIKPQDPLAIPKPVAVEAEVEEGAKFRVGEIVFLENRVVSSEKLRAAFPLKTGDVFERGKVVSGIENLRKLYGSNGFLDFVLIPETEPSSNGTMILTVTVKEGPQYHMGKLEIAAEKEAEARLRGVWKLAEGSPYDPGYISEFIEQNHSLLPSGFTTRDVRQVFNCPDALVEVTLMVDGRERTSETPAKSIPCESRPEKTK